MTTIDPALVRFFATQVERDLQTAQRLAADPEPFARERFGRRGRLQWVASVFDERGAGGLGQAQGDLEAKRRLVEAWEGAEGEGAVALGFAIAHLAAAYSEQPGYYEWWAPR